MSVNLALNKPAASSSYVLPYAASRAVDGSIAPVSRWVCKTLPGWVSVDLGATYCIDRWVVKQMQLAGWDPTYNLVDYSIQGSTDNVNWKTMDSVYDNTAGSTDRMCAPFRARYVRLFVTKGIRINTQLASVMEFEVYEAPPTSNYLTELSLSSGTLTPAFSQTLFEYTASVIYDTPVITLLPRAEDPRAKIYVNGISVPGGQSSQPIPLQIGSNTITVQVEPYSGNPQNYVITVTRASNPYLSGITVKSGRVTVPLTPAFDKNTLVYTGTVASIPSVGVIAVAADAANSEITIKGTAATSGALVVVPLTSGQVNDIPIVIRSKIGSDSKTYTIKLTVG